MKHLRFDGVAKWLVQGSLPAGLGLCLVVVLPSLAWVLIDRAPFGGDQSQYASATLELYRSWTLTPSAWADAMTRSVGFKAPGIAWLGQWFVPLRSIVGSADAALMLSIVATQAVTLLLVFRTLWILSEKSILASLTGCLLMAVAPLFQLLSHHYLIEPLQLLAVAWFVLIMSHAPHWNRAFTLAQLVAATSVAMLAKTSSPLYCVGPALVTLGFVLGVTPARTPWGWGRSATLFAWIAAVPLSIGTGCWYYQNIVPALRHVRMATSGPIAAMWGKEDTFLNSFAYWIDTVSRVFFLAPSLALAAIIVVSGLAGYLSRPDQRKRYFTLCCVVSVLQITFVLAAFAFGSNREGRYLLALLPYFALIVGWGISHIPRPAAAIVATGILAFVWAAASGHSLHLFDIGSRAFGPIPRVTTDAHQAAIIREIVTRTCADPDGNPYFNTIAIDPTLKGDWLAPAPADYVAAREYLGSGSGAPCSYGYAGDGFLGSDAATAWTRLLERRTRYVVTFDPRIYPPPEKSYNEALNRQNFPILIERLTTSRDFERLAPLAADPGILIFRSTGRPAERVVAAQSGKLAVDLAETRRLFGLISEKRLGDVHGLAEMRDAGILVHPGATTPTQVSFDIAGRYGNLTLVAFIASLPPEALATTTAGTAGVEFFVDGKSTGRVALDRLANYEKTLDLKDAKTLSVTVDNADGSPWWDWLLIAVK